MAWDTDELIVGDWNGDGSDDVGVTRDVGVGKAVFLDRNSNGVFDAGVDSFTFFRLASDETFIGDWDGDGVDDIGATRAVGGNKALYRDLNGNGSYDDGIDSFTYFGITSDTIIVGVWTLPLLAAESVAADPVEEPSLTVVQLQPIVLAAVDLLAQTGLSASQLQQLQQVNVYVADLSGARLGQATGNTITLDASAAGYGWFIDETPYVNEEFALTGDSLIALSDSAANGRMDLLTAVLHELEHVLGSPDEYSDLDSESLMYGWLATGTRRTTSTP